MEAIDLDLRWLPGMDKTRHACPEYQFSAPPARIDAKNHMKGVKFRMCISTPTVLEKLLSNFIKSRPAEGATSDPAVIPR
jgi:hypothetical protein